MGETPEAARTYIVLVRKYIVPGMNRVTTNGGRNIDLDNMTDEDAMFCAEQFRGWEIEAAQRSSRSNKRKPS